MGPDKAVIACSLAALLLVAACSSADAVSDPDREVIIADERVRPEIPSQGSAQLLRETRLFDDPAPLMNVQSTYGVAPVILDPGTYEFDALGTTLTLTLEDYWRLESERPGSFDITRPTAELEALLPAVTFHRPVGFADPFLAGSNGPWVWYMQDLAEWIEAMPQIVVLDSGELTVDDRTARWWDIDVDPELGPTKPGCEPGRCVDFMWSGSYNFSVARDLERIRWYEIPDTQGPIIVFIAAEDEDFGPLTVEIDRMLTTAVVGPSQPNPVAGDVLFAKWGFVDSNTPTRIAGIEGLVVESPAFVEIEQRPGEFLAWRRGDWRPDRHVGIALPVSDLDEQPLDTVDEIVAAIEANTIDAETSDDEILGLPAVRIDFESPDEGLLQLSPRRSGYDIDQATWPNLPHVRAHVFESPLGPAILFAGAESGELVDEASVGVPWFADLLSFCQPADSCDAER